MARLSVYSDTDPTVIELSSADPALVTAHLALAGVLFERWPTPQAIPDTANAQTVLDAYAGPVAALKEARGFQSADVVRMPRGLPDAAARRAAFLAEHTHDEDEARFFVQGGGAFYLHMDEKVYCIVCGAGDLLSIPAWTKHWFDMGPDPDFTAIRFFTRPDGWVASFTGDVIADRFPKFEPEPGAAP